MRSRIRSATLRKHPAFQKVKWTLLTFQFLKRSVIFALLDPDPGTPLNPDPIRIHNTGTYRTTWYKHEMENVRMLPKCTYFSGRRAQSKKLLETPGLRYNHAKMTFIMNRWQESTVSRSHWFMEGIRNQGLFCQFSLSLKPVLRNRNYLLRFWFRLLTSYGSGSGSISI